MCGPVSKITEDWQGRLSNRRRRHSKRSRPASDLVRDDWLVQTYGAANERGARALPQRYAGGLSERLPLVKEEGLGGEKRVQFLGGGEGNAAATITTVLVYTHAYNTYKCITNKKGTFDTPCCRLGDGRTGVLPLSGTAPCYYLSTEWKSSRSLLCFADPRAVSTARAPMNAHRLDLPQIAYSMDPERGE